jgi:hypothetical protein
MGLGVASLVGVILGLAWGAGLSLVTAGERGRIVLTRKVLVRRILVGGLWVIMAYVLMEVAIEQNFGFEAQPVFECLRVAIPVMFASSFAFTVWTRAIENGRASGLRGNKL